MSPQSPSQSPRTALVTGANKGIGLEVVRGLARAGLTVYLAARNPDLGRAAADTLRAEGLLVHNLVLDITDQGSVAQAVATLAEQIPALDLLINNAGIADRGDGPPSAADLAALERIFATNFVGAVRVTQALLPLLRKSAAGSILNVSSGLGSITYAADPASPYFAIRVVGYASSKAALNMFTAHLAGELAETGIRVNSIDPGYTATDLNGNSGPQTIAEGAAEILRVALLPAAETPTAAFLDTNGPVPW